MSKQFYVYLHSTQSTGVFYVGKGDEARCKQIMRPHNPHHTKICMKNGTDNIQVTLIPCASEQAALELETSMIIAMRKAGVELVNQTAGNATVENEQIKEISKRLNDIENRVLSRNDSYYPQPRSSNKPQYDIYSSVLHSISRTGKEGLQAGNIVSVNRRYKALSKHDRSAVMSDLLNRGDIALIKTKQKSGQNTIRYVATKQAR